MKQLNSFTLEVSKIETFVWFHHLCFWFAWISLILTTAWRLHFAPTSNQLWSDRQNLHHNFVPTVHHKEHAEPKEENENILLKHHRRNIMDTAKKNQFCLNIDL
jgi:hypothetical protein